MFNLGIQSVLFGFSIYSIFMLLAIQFNKRYKNFILNHIDPIACGLFSIAGLCFIGNWLYELQQAYALISVELERYSTLNRMFGSYSLYYWLPVILPFIATQLLWFKKLQRIKWLRWSVIMMVLTPTHQVLLFLQPLNRYYATSSWEISITDQTIDYITQLIIFIGLIANLYLIKTRFKSLI